MSKEKEDVLKAGPVKILKANDPATLKILNEYLDFHKGKDREGKPFTKFRRYRPDVAAENVYHYKKLGKDVSFAVAQSFKIENAEKPAKDRQLNIIGKQIAAGGVGRIKEVERGRGVELINPATGEQWVYKVLPYVNEGEYPFSQDRGWAKEPLQHRFTVRDIKAEYDVTAELIGGGGFSVRPTSERGGKIYMILPKYHGKELYYEAKKEMNFDEKLKIAILSLEDLKRIHDKGYVHCDIKAENIMYDKDTKKGKEIRLFDFGFSIKGIKSDSVHKDNYGKFYAKQGFRGTKGFFSPELIASAETINKDQLYTYTEKSDLYAMGIMIAGDLRLSEMIYVPENNSPVSAPVLLNLEILERDMVDVMGKEGAQSVNKFILKMTAPNPKDRYTVDEALKEIYALRDIRNKITGREVKDVKERVEKIPAKEPKIIPVMQPKPFVIQPPKKSEAKPVAGAGGIQARIALFGGKKPIRVMPVIKEAEEEMKQKKAAVPPAKPLKKPPPLAPQLPKALHAAQKIKAQPPIVPAKPRQPMPVAPKIKPPLPAWPPKGKADVKAAIPKQPPLPKIPKKEAVAGKVVVQEIKQYHEAKKQNAPVRPPLPKPPIVASAAPNKPVETGFSGALSLFKQKEKEDRAKREQEAKEKAKKGTGRDKHKK